MRLFIRHIILASILFAGIVSQPITSAQEVQTADPAKVDADYAFQGEYSGKIKSGEAKSMGVQVIALGKGKFRAIAMMGGLPGDGWNGENHSIEGNLVDGKVVFEAEGVAGVLKDGKVSVTIGGQEAGTLDRVVRKSLTLGKKPPSDAVVLFDGKSTDEWAKVRGGEAVMSDGLLHEGVNSKRRFQDCQLHIEFRLPYAPKARGQKRGNSGLYLQGRYEVQMLDSFGLEGKQNECGGVYGIAAPKLNMCYPPLQWQTYDVDFMAAKFDVDGKKTKNATMTVRHNGVVIHENLELPKSTTASPLKEGAEPGFIHLQNHGNPVRYRNIWIVEK